VLRPSTDTTQSVDRIRSICFLPPPQPYVLFHSPEARRWRVGGHPHRRYRRGSAGGL